MGGLRGAGGLALTTAPCTRCARISTCSIPRRNSLRQARDAAAAGGGPAPARRRDGDARQRQARPGLAEGELQPLRRRRVGDGEL
ncbi:hypothetical protein JS561_05155 [Salmonella enterica subsp. enterica serovar Infantis]|nr:hypothetical protein JS561_05155 [Salmonella enterica subsp. enterica serovar Infantis]